MLSTVILIIILIILVGGVSLWLYGERWWPLRNSTWKLARAGGLRWLLNLSGLNAYLYGRWVKEYINVVFNYICPLLGPRGKKWLTDRLHSKVLTPELAQAIINLDHDISLRDLEQIIPYPIARDLVLKGPPDVAVFQCGCRQTRKNPCHPIQVCMAIGQPFVDFILEHHPHSSRRLTQEEALELLQAEHKRGHLHSAWFKDACLDRFYAICNCCKCCCGGIIAMTKHSVPIMAPSGYAAQVDETHCTACAICQDVCPFGAIQMNGIAVVNWEACMGCGVCVGQCSTQSLSLVRDEKKGKPLDVRLLTSTCNK